jgi:hypothetical protein
MNDDESDFAGLFLIEALVWISHAMPGPSKGF